MPLWRLYPELFHKLWWCMRYTLLLLGRSKARIVRASINALACRGSIVRTDDGNAVAMNQFDPNWLLI